MLTPEQLLHVADKAVETYSKLEQSIIKDIVRRLEGTEMIMTESARWQIKVAQEAGMLYDDIIAQVAKHSSYTEKEVRKTFEESAIKALKFDDDIYKKAGLKPIPIKQSENMLNILMNTLNKTNNSLYNLTLTTAKTSQQAYIKALDEAYMEVISGAFDSTTAIKRAVKRLNQGVQVEYDSGYKCNIKTAVKRAVQTGVNQTCLRMSEERADEMRL